MRFVARAVDAAILVVGVTVGLVVTVAVITYWAVVDVLGLGEP